MAAVGMEEDLAVQAARILLSLRRRRLLRPPEWVQPASGEAPASAKVPREWPKRQRSRLEMLPGDWKAALASLKLGRVAASSRSGAWSSGEDGDRSPPRARERERARPAAGDALMLAAAVRKPATPLYYGAPAGSGLSTSSADRAARTQRRQRHAAEKPETKVADAAAAEPPKETMSASSPETPLDFAFAAAGSNASSSGDDPARAPPKRRARGSGDTSSGDEGCSSPAKRARAVGGGKDAAEEKEPKMPSEPSTGNRDEAAVKFAFDLNMPWTDECPDIC